MLARPTIAEGKHRPPIENRSKHDGKPADKAANSRRSHSKCSKHLVTSAKIATIAAREEDVAASVASRPTASVGDTPLRVLAHASWPHDERRQSLMSCLLMRCHVRAKGGYNWIGRRPPLGLASKAT